MVQRQEKLQFAAEIGGALGRARVRLRKVQSKRHERDDDPKVAHLLAVNRLDSNDSDDTLSGNAKLVSGTLKCRPVGFPKLDAGADANRIDEAAAVQRTVFYRAGRRWLHQLCHNTRQIGVAQDATRPRGVQGAALCNVVARRKTSSRSANAAPCRPSARSFALFSAVASERCSVIAVKK